MTDSTRKSGIHDAFTHGVVPLLLALCGITLLSSLAGAIQDQGDSSLKGKFLVAVGTMGDPRFEKSVIYMIEHSGDGAMGLIINKVLGDLSGEELAQRLKIPEPSEEIVLKVHFGGPVGLNQLFLLHTFSSENPPEASKKIEGEIGLSTDPELLRSFIQGKGPDKMRILQGYAGWAPGQLENELSREDWKVMEADPSQLFSEEVEGLWEELMEETVFRL